MAKRKAAEFDSASSSSLPNEEAYLRTNFPAESGCANATLEPSGQQNWKSDKYGLTLRLDPSRDPSKPFWWLRGRDGHALAGTKDFKTWYAPNQKPFEAPVTVLDVELRQRKPAALAVASTNNVYMHVLRFEQFRHYSYLAGSYYAVGEQHGERSYHCYTNNLTMCRLPEGNWCLQHGRGEVAKSVAMTTWWLADGRNVDANCWAIVDPRPVTIVDPKPVTVQQSSRSSQPRSERQTKPASSSQPSQPRSERQAKPASSSLPSQPSQSQTPKAQQPQPASPEDQPKARQMAYDMGKVRAYYENVHKTEVETPLAVREDEACDLKVIYEIFSKEGYKNQTKAGRCFERRSGDIVLDLGAHLGAAAKWFLEPRPVAVSRVDCYEPGSTYSLLQRNFQNDSRARLHHCAVMSAEMSTDHGSVNLSGIEKVGVHTHLECILVVSGGQL